MELCRGDFRINAQALIGVWDLWISRTHLNVAYFFLLLQNTFFFGTNFYLICRNILYTLTFLMQNKTGYILPFLAADE